MLPHQQPQYYAPQQVGNQPVYQTTPQQTPFYAPCQLTQPLMMNSMYGNTMYPTQSAMMQSLPVQSPVMPTAASVYQPVSQPTPSTPNKPSKVPNQTTFCANWEKCEKTRDEEHRCNYRHKCTIKDCQKTNDPVHKQRFLHVCRYGKECKNMTDEVHCRNFIHPCKYNEKCTKIDDALHRIFFSHDLKKLASNNGSFPDTWKPTAKVNDSYKQYATLSNTSPEYKKVESSFLSSINHSHSTAAVKSIVRIENFSLWERYANKLVQVQQKNKSKDPQFKTLYHGADEATINSIQKDGFDYRFCTVGFYGCGAYFAVNSSYSHGYATPNGAGERKILVCRVIVGSAMRVAQKNQSLTRPFDASTGITYDSVQGGPNGTEYVIFDNAHAYPEYCITYT